MIEHTTNECPVPPQSWVIYDLGDGRQHGPERAATLAWGPGVGPNGEGRILRYCVTEPDE